MSFPRELNHIWEVKRTAKALAEKPDPMMIVDYYKDWNSDKAPMMILDDYRDYSRDLENEDRIKMGYLRKKYQKLGK
jgi:hypothetical protein